MRRKLVRPDGEKTAGILRLNRLKSNKFAPPENRTSGKSHASLLAVLAAILAGVILPATFPLARAGDILRGGASSASGQRAAAARANAGADAANVAKTKAADRLARTTKAISDMRGLQEAARAAAGSGGVPDGLVTGGLERLAGGTWTGAQAPVQSGNNVNIRQTAAQALLDWKTFNVGKNTTVNFDQSAGQSDTGKWIAFNKVFDPSGKPSQIRGQINADGQVYIINQNGIIFGAGSQVNTRTLVASSLPINDNLIQRGLLNQVAGNVQFLFSGQPGDGFDASRDLNGDGVLTPGVDYIAYARSGDVVVEPGATLSSPVSVEGYGGRALLVGKNVNNNGVISTPAGQTILAAGLQVGIDAHSSSDPSLRGLDAFVGAVSNPALGISGGDVSNGGIIEIPRGNLVMLGKQVFQSGVVVSTTSVDVNGRVDLLAQYDAVVNPSYDATKAYLGGPFLLQSTGLVELGLGSVIQLLPESDLLKTIARSELPLRSQVNITGQTVHFGPKSSVLAPNGEININAGEWIYQPTLVPPSSTFLNSSGQVYFDEDSLVDVSGLTDVRVLMSQSIVSLQLRGSELANSPLQRSSDIRGIDITVDLNRTGTYYGTGWVGTPLGDATGYANLIERNASQLSLIGGDVTIAAGTSIVVHSGAVIDVSGGYARNEGGRIQTTRLLRGGVIVDIANATPDVVYDGVYDGKTTHGSQKWGVSSTYLNALAPLGSYLQPEYVAGANAGTISITTPSMAIAGELRGKTVVGPRQLRDSAISSALPKAGGLQLIFEKRDKTATTLGFPAISPTPPTVLFDSAAGTPDAAPAVAKFQGQAAISQENLSKVVLNPQWIEAGGFGDVLVRNSEGDIIVSKDSPLRLPPNGSLELSGANVTVNSDIIAPGGRVTLTAYTYSPYRAKYLDPTAGDILPQPDPFKGTISLAKGVAIRAAGTITDDRPTGAVGSITPIALDAGSISLEAFRIQLPSGSAIDVSGGVAFGANGKFQYGNAGAISILSGQDPNLSGILGGSLELNASLSGFSGKDFNIAKNLADSSTGRSGGALTIKSSRIQIGGTPSDPDILALQPDFFNQGGFSQFTLIGIGALDKASKTTMPGVFIAPGTEIAPMVRSAVATPSRTGGLALQPLLKPVGLRDPVSLSFQSTGANDELSGLPLVRGDTVFGSGASISIDPLGKVAFQGQTVAIQGTVDAPGGQISIQGASAFPQLVPGLIALPTVYLAPEARLSARGASLLVPDPYGRKRGYVLPGGSISVSGNIIASLGAVLDVSGTSGSLDLTPAELGVTTSPEPMVSSGVTSPLYSRQTSPTLVESNGGQITLKGAALLLSDATLLGKAGGPTAVGGSLSISSGRYIAPNQPSTKADVNLIIQQNGEFLPAQLSDIAAKGGNFFDHAEEFYRTTLLTNPAALAEYQQLVPYGGSGLFSVEKIEKGGFSSLDLGGNVRFRGPVTISATQELHVAAGGVIRADAMVNLSAPYVRLGQAFQEPLLAEQENFLFTQTDNTGITTEYHPVPTSGSGSLNVFASLIDVGTLVLNQISAASLTAIDGDIRGNGTLVMAGDLTLRAGQIYPTTASLFDIFAYDNTLTGQAGSVTITGAGTRPLPYSAGGSLRIMASRISQAGTLRAPQGSISLGWDGIMDAPTNSVVGTAAPALTTPVTKDLSLMPGSMTSVSSIDPSTGGRAILPYGMSPDGLSWLSPSGLDVTLTGLPTKGVTLAASNLAFASGAVIDVRGGGDLYAYRWVEGNGGSTDILAFENRFAIIPGYGFSYAPYAPFNSGADSLLGDAGYQSSGLKAGSQVTLKASPGLPAGTYTLLPARYALLPGAILVTPFQALGASASDPYYQFLSSPPGSIALSDGSNLVSGFQSNAYLAGRGLPSGYSTFQVLSQDAVRTRAEYQDFFANDFLKTEAARQGATPQRLPADSGTTQFFAGNGLNLSGSIWAAPAEGGRGAKVDIAALGEIWITDNGAVAPAGAIRLDASILSSWNIESLLVGGYRVGDNVNVRATGVTVDNRGADFVGPEIILAANQTLTLAPGARVASTGSMTEAPAALVLNGDGALLRVSGSDSATTLRFGSTGLASVNLTIGDGARISGPSVTLDSTYNTDLSPTALISGQAINLNSGRISILLDNPLPASPAYGLVLEGGVLKSLAGAGSLSLLSYSSMDFYGSGLVPFGDPSSLSLRAASIRGFNQNGGTVIVRAENLTLDNAQDGIDPGSSGALDGKLLLDVDTLRVGSNTVNVYQFSDLVINAPGGIYGDGVGGLSTAGNISGSVSVLSASAASIQTISAAGDLVLNAVGGSPSQTPGLGASLSILGRSVTVNSDIILPSGSLEVASTAGQVFLGGQVDLSGTSKVFYDLTEYTGGGSVSLSASGGDVVVGGKINVSASSGGGDAGSVSVTVPEGQFFLLGDLLGTAGSGGNSGSFLLDANGLAGAGELDALNVQLAAGSFFESRTFRIRNGDVSLAGSAMARHFELAVDNGNLAISGIVDASGATGGSIDLSASGDLTLLAGSLLTVAAQHFDDAGKGGDISLGSGSQQAGVTGAGVLDLQTGSFINLSVADKVAGDATTPGSSAFYAQFSGTLRLRAPRLGGGAGRDISLAEIGSTIIDASSVLAEGYKVYSDATGDISGSAGTITSALQNLIKSEGDTFLGSSGVASPNYTAMLNRLLAANPSLASVFVLAPGVEIINRAGDLTLGSISSTATSDWNLQTFRFDAKSAPGVLTLRASGDLVFYNALSDGFSAVTSTATSGNSSLWLAPLMTANTLLPMNTQSWSLNLTAGADLSGSISSAVLPVSSLLAGKGSLLLGKDASQALTSGGTNAQTSTAINNHFQVIRTGTGDIDIHAARDLKLLNQFATIYTAGVAVSNAKNIFSVGDFSVPITAPVRSPSQGGLGAVQQLWTPQYSMAGGNLSIAVGVDMGRYTKLLGTLVEDSSRQTPGNWLYRRGYVGADGTFGVGGVSSGPTSVTDPSASTTWWIDFSNFFEGVGALGGGNVSLVAGNDIKNIDAFVPTNARMPSGTPDLTKLVELGGGDLSVQAGRDISAGIYYVERGEGTLQAGRNIVTNQTRSPSLGIVGSPSSPVIIDSQSWLPTTLYLGKGGFDVSAQGDVLLGPVVNPFLLPGGLNNRYWNKSYFSTYSGTSHVQVASIGGDITLRTATTLSDETSEKPILMAWMQKQNLYTGQTNTAAYYQPWLRLLETDVLPFETMFTLQPSSLQMVAYSGDINLVGTFNLNPSATGNIVLEAAENINGLQPNGRTTQLIRGSTTVAWSSAVVNLSDANPDAIPGLTTPLAYQSIVGNSQGNLNTTRTLFLSNLDALFAESGSYTESYGVVQTKQALHTPGLLHGSDQEPLRLYALGGNISGLTLFSAKASRVLAGNDISDIGLYIQNLSESDVSIVSAGRDIVAYNSSSPLRVAALTTGNALNSGQVALAGDIQINGPGTLEVLAGRDLDLGTGAPNSDGTGTGITSIGNSRNPYLPFGGASMYVAAGLGSANGPSLSGLQVEDFLNQYLDQYLAEVSGDDSTFSVAGLSSEGRSQLAVQILYLVLRDAGRNSVKSGSYSDGFLAISTLFGSQSSANGDIKARSRDIRTKNGGDISILAPHGSISLAESIIGDPLAPPGIVTEYGGSIGIFTFGDVTIGQARIFTLRGGNIAIWSSTGDIAAGAASKTVATAPPTRVLIDPQSATIETDLSGLATGGGIGVLSTVAGVKAGDVDLIAPVGVVDAGDAGIRASGNLNIAATQVLNADNISASGSTTGVPSAPTVAAPNVSGLASGNSSTAATSNAASSVANQANQAPQEALEAPSIITVEVIGYGGGEGDEG